MYDNETIDKAFFILLPRPRKLRVVKISSYLKELSNYSLQLIHSIVYSLVTKPSDRYYYTFVVSFAYINLEGKALVKTSNKKEPFLLIDFTEIYEEEDTFPTSSKLKSEILDFIN